jgi:hypothetical protein
LAYEAIRVAYRRSESEPIFVHIIIIFSLTEFQHLQQLRRWEALNLTTAQKKEVERLMGQMKRLHEVITAILALADELKGRTIEKVMAKSDLELGVEALLRLSQDERQKGS